MTSHESYFFSFWAIWALKTTHYIALRLRKLLAAFDVLFKLFVQNSPSHSNLQCDYVCLAKLRSIDYSCSQLTFAFIFFKFEGEKFLGQMASVGNFRGH